MDAGDGELGEDEAVVVGGAAPAKRPSHSDSWHRVAGLRPMLRPGVIAHRQTFRGETWHVLEDPLSGGTSGRAGGTGGFHRLNGPAWHFVSLLDGRRSVEQALAFTREAMGDDAPTQPEAVTLLGQLGAANLLGGELDQDTLALYRRARRRAARDLKGTLASVLAIRMPLTDPDRLLGRLEPVLGAVFTPMGVAAWAVLVVAGLAHLAPRSSELVSGVGSVLSAGNLGWLYAAFALCKLVHEMGHGLAVKRMARVEGVSGEVHTLGVMLLVLMPAPYVDATSVWALRSKWRRIAVGAAGMYAELALASVAAMVWSRTAEGTLIHALAFNVVFIAGVSTLVFNANPLLRYDGYYMLADLLETPNLATRAREQVFHWVRSRVWGVRGSVSPSYSTGEAVMLAGYHVVSTAYRLVVFTALAVFVMGQWFIVGALAGLALVVGMVVAPVCRYITYLAWDPALGRVRTRAVWTSAAATIAGGLVLGAWAIPERVRLDGVYEPRASRDVFARHGGVVELIAGDGQRVTAGQAVCVLRDRELECERAQRAARLAWGEARLRRAVVDDPASARVEVERVGVLRAALLAAEQELESLTMRAEGDGVWSCPESGPLAGSYVRAGERVGVVLLEGAGRIRAVAGQGEASRLASLGDAISARHAEARAWGRPEPVIGVRLAPPAPAGTSALTIAALGEGAGGAITPARDIGSGAEHTAERYFEVLVTPTDAGEAGAAMRYGQRVVVRVDLGRSSILSQAARAVRRVFQERFSVPL